MSSSRIPNDSRLVVAANLVETAIPLYDANQSDPLIAAEKGHGNSLTKAVIGAILLEKAMLTGAIPALCWNAHTHPTTQSTLGTTKLIAGPVYLLSAPRESNPYDVNALSFNPDRTDRRSWELFNINDDEQYALRSNDHVVATPAGITIGYYIRDWHDGGKEYSQAIGAYDSVFHSLSRQELQVSIINHLVARNVLMEPLQTSPIS